ncbi:DUF4340 domain-containing protein [Methylophilus sp. Leaf414]|uniref:DUF4340 domain-containing protein n=1 Tax=Methylophilus sp. Leaf414 TaxID=1736371 RepID=UPI0006FD0278|nr:DUF4340 domain-containing protein [Methylophilus sp. Leaf414]KQT38058.1 hypothetical protein ASG24_03555 [Methylophilus sp. Leaf414]
MKKRWILNLLLLAVVVGIAVFLHLKPEEKALAAKYDVSSLKMADAEALKIEFPAKAPTIFERQDGYWMMRKPYAARADQMSVQRALSIIAATSGTKLPLQDAAKYGLDQPELKVTLSGAQGEHVFIFGTHNPVTEEQYVGYAGNVYMLSGQYSEAASTQPIEMIDKTPLSPAERKQLAGLDLAHLEQWEENALKIELATDGKWSANDPKAKPTQNEMNEWLDFSWKQAQATSVEVYTPDRRQPYASFEVLLRDGKKVHFDKIQESPEYLLARPDEGIIYHFPNDVGFTMVNPPVNIQAPKSK